MLRRENLNISTHSSSQPRPFNPPPTVLLPRSQPFQPSGCSVHPNHRPFSGEQQTSHTGVSGPCLLRSLCVACSSAPTHTALAPSSPFIHPRPERSVVPQNQGCALVFVCNSLMHFVHVYCSPLKVVILDRTATLHIWTAHFYHLLEIESCWSYTFRLK